MSASDEELIHGFTSGGEVGFTAFYNRFAAVLFSINCRILHDRTEAEDSVQDAFVQMWKQSSGFDPARGSLFTWAVMIARARALDRLRRLQTYHRATEAAIADGTGTKFQRRPGPDDDLMQGEERMRVRVALALLSEQQREAVSLAFFTAMTHIEISRTLQVPLGTIKARIRRGLIALRDTLHPRGMVRDTDALASAVG